jgi:hypothetical protein
VRQLPWYDRAEARRELARAVLLFDSFRAAALPKPRFQMVQRFDEMAHMRRASDRLRSRRFFGHQTISLSTV